MSSTNDDGAQAREAAKERRRKVAALRRETGMTQIRIASILGVSSATVSRDIQALDRNRSRRVRAGVKRERRTDLDRLDRILRAVVPRAETGDLKAVDRVLAIIDRRIILLGLDVINESFVSSDWQVEDDGDEASVESETT